MSASQSLADRIDAVLPQTQCAQCGYSGCRPYAEAIATQAVNINRCPPGGQRTILELARVTGRKLVPLDTEYGQEEPLQCAKIVEVDCIGCTLCIQACPVDAIVGAPKRMHTVVSDLCTGCGLCVTPCPVDCIIMLPATSLWDSQRAHAARARFEARKMRLKRENDQARISRSTTAVREGAQSNSASAEDAAGARKRAIIDAALERARKLRANRTHSPK